MLRFSFLKAEVPGFFTGIGFWDAFLIPIMLSESRGVDFFLDFTFVFDRENFVMCPLERIPDEVSGIFTGPLWVREFAWQEDLRDSIFSKAAQYRLGLMLRLILL